MYQWELWNDTGSCDRAQLEDFLVQSRALLIQLLPESDEEDTSTVAGFVSYIVVS